jgi:hypothetical protein
MKDLLQKVSLIKSKILTVMLMLMVFIGQTAAATNDSCHMNTVNQNIHLSMDTTSHIAQDTVSHIVKSGSVTQSNMSDCCTQDCNCPLGDCSSVLLLSSPHQNWEMIALQKKAGRLFLVTRQSTTTLYRPPISL